MGDFRGLYLDPWTHFLMEYGPGRSSGLLGWNYCVVVRTCQGIWDKFPAVWTPDVHPVHWHSSQPTPQLFLTILLRVYLTISYTLA